MANELMLGQIDFSGGVNYPNPGENQVYEMRNMVIRNGRATTRPGIRQHFNVNASFVGGFYFNEENAVINDASHTGFWFGVIFTVPLFSGAIQGCGQIQLTIHSSAKYIIATKGQVYIYENGAPTPINCTPAITSTEDVEFVQANDQVFMFRGESLTPYYWNGSSGGFIPVPTPVAADRIHNAQTAIYHAGRLWVPNGDDLYASNILDFTVYDDTRSAFSAARLQSEAGIFLYPFHDNNILIFKKTKILMATGVNTPLDGREFLSNNVVIATIDENIGCIAHNTPVTVGEDVWFLGYGGIYSLKRNAQNRIDRNPVAISEPISNIIDRINWAAAGHACGAVFNNYILFAVPLDNSLTNNAVMVYDLQANGGAGSWCGTWESGVLNPVRFFNDNEKLLFLGVDGVIRRMFVDSPWDSDDPIGDTPAYSATKTYNGTGELVYFESGGDKIFRNTSACVGIDPTDVTCWEEVTDIYSVYNIETYIRLREMTIPGSTQPLRFGRAEVMFRHQNPCITIESYCRDHGDTATIFDSVTYDRTKYDIGGVANWVPSNAQLDFDHPHRQDYTVFINNSGLYIDSNGIELEAWETHSLRWVPMQANIKSFGVTITNSSGKIELQGVRCLVNGRRFAHIDTL